MYHFTFESQGTNTYLVYKIREEDCIDTMSLGMMTNNKIPGIASAIFNQIDMNKFIKYNVSAKISVKQFFGGPVNKKRLIGVFESIINGLLAAEDYMIDTTSVVLDLDYIFVDVTTCEAVLICLPVGNYQTLQRDWGEFFKNIMFHTQFDQTENCDYVAKIINFLNCTPVFSLNNLKVLLSEIKNERSGTCTVNVQSTPQPKVLQPSLSQPGVSSYSARPASPESLKPVMDPIESPVKTPVAPKIKETQSQTGQSAEGKKISLLGLLTHYSKENAALYKQQKASKKSEKSSAVQKKNKKQQPENFSIPGQASLAAQPQNEYTKSRQQPMTQQPVIQQRIRTNPALSEQSSRPASMPQGGNKNFGDTTILGGETNGLTTVLPTAQQCVDKPRLLRAKNSEEISINKPVFRIGKERSYVDYFISDNTAVSRSHANIINRDGAYFVVDTNSRNHTFINNSMIQPNVETGIVHGDKIRLANEDFEFRLY